MESVLNKVKECEEEKEEQEILAKKMIQIKK